MHDQVLTDTTSARASRGSAPHAGVVKVPIPLCAWTDAPTWARKICRKIARATATDEIIERNAPRAVAPRQASRGRARRAPRRAAKKPAASADSDGEPPDEDGPLLLTVIEPGGRTSTLVVGSRAEIDGWLQ